MRKMSKYLFLIGLVLCLLQVWLPQFFVTGDGPSHVYNAQVLHDIWCNKNVTFYTRFYTAVYKPNPNWLSTAAMALFMLIVNGVIAEKIFLTFYVLIFVCGFYLLLKKISNNNSYWPLVVFIFVFTHPLCKGFYNFSFSIAFYFWMVWSWLRFLDKKNIVNAVLFFLFVGLTFFTHLLAFVFGAFTCAALIVSYALAAGQDGKTKKLPFLFTNTALLTLLLFPFLVLMRWFTEKEGGMNILLYHHFRRLIELVQFRYIINITHQEDYFALIAGVLLLVAVAVSLVRFRNKLKINKYDGFLLSLLFVGFVYLFFPEDFLGRLILIALRVQLFVFIIIACIISYMLPSEKLKNLIAFILFGCFIGLSIVRIPCRQAASEGVAAYVSGTDFIKPYSVVLPLDFSPGGEDEHGKLIGDRNWVFCHAAQYMGTEKPMIILDNYEANMGYFPLVWNNNVNPYNLLSKDEGIEGQPPFASIAGYKKNAGVTIDYILMWCYNDSYLQNEHFRTFFAEINNGYHIIYTSPAGRTILYELNKQP